MKPNLGLRNDLYSCLAFVRDYCSTESESFFFFPQILNFSQAHSQKQKHIAKAAKDIIIALLD